MDEEEEEEEEEGEEDDDEDDDNVDDEGNIFCPSFLCYSNNYNKYYRGRKHITTI
jgi:hypothetical protein